LDYLKKNNTDIDLDKFATLVTQVKATKNSLAIKEYILSLRTIRHNALCYKKNDVLLDRDDRQVWKNDTILRAFKANSLATFKKFTEESAGDSPDDLQWCKRWNDFVESVNKETDDTRKKAIISKFLTVQRTKKYRRSIDNGGSNTHV